MLHHLDINPFWQQFVELVCTRFATSETDMVAQWRHFYCPLLKATLVATKHQTHCR
jgi:hypothetical protein